MEVTDQQFKQGQNAVSALDTLSKVQALLTTIHATGTHMSFALPKNEKILEIDSFELSKEGGIYVYYKDCPHARKGFAHNPSVTAVDNVKKVIIGLAKGFAGFKGKFILLAFFGSSLCTTFRVFRSITNLPLSSILYLAVWFLRVHFPATFSLSGDS